MLSEPPSGQGRARQMAGRPSSLKIKPPRLGIHVQSLAREIQTRGLAAFHGFGLDVPEVDATTGDKLLLVATFSVDLEDRMGQTIHQCFQHAWSQLAPGSVCWHLAPLEHAMPKPLGQSKWDGIADMFFSVRACIMFQVFGGLTNPWDPMNVAVEWPLSIVNFSGGPTRQFENGRSAQTPMGQQKGTVTPDITPWQVTADVFDTETLKAFDQPVVDLKGKQRRDGRNDPMANGLHHTNDLPRLHAAPRPQALMGPDGAIVFELNLPMARVRWH